MYRLALGLNCWPYLNRDSIPIQNMELVKETNGNNNRCNMILEVQAGQGFVSLKQDENAYLANDFPAEIITNEHKKSC